MTRSNAALFLAEKFNLEYLHRPLKDPQCPQLDWDFFFGFWKNKLQYDDVVKKKTLKMIDLPVMPRMTGLDIFLLGKIINNIHPQSDVVFVAAGATGLEEGQAPLFWMSLYSSFQGIYRENMKKFPIESRFDKSKIKVTVHIRRSEISNFKKRGNWRGDERWVDNAWYCGVLENLNRIFCEKNIEMHVYSDASDLKEIEACASIPNVKIYLKKDDPHQPYYAFYEFSMADIGVCGGSGFSTLAGNLSRGIIIYPPVLFVQRMVFRHKSISWNKNLDWIESDKNGDFDSKAMLERLKKINITG